MPFCRFSHALAQKWKWYIPITKTCLCNADPLQPHFYIVNWGLQGYTLFVLFLLKNIDCGSSLEPPRRGVRTHNICFEQKYENISFIWKFSFFGGKIFNIFQKACFRNDCQNKIKLEWRELWWPVYCGWLELVVEVLGNSSDNSRKQVFRDV